MSISSQVESATITMDEFQRIVLLLANQRFVRCYYCLELPAGAAIYRKEKV